MQSKNKVLYFLYNGYPLTEVFYDENISKIEYLLVTFVKTGQYYQTFIFARDINSHAFILPYSEYYLYAFVKSDDNSFYIENPSSVDVSSFRIVKIVGIYN